jgi:hypothetical protein
MMISTPSPIWFLCSHCSEKLFLADYSEPLLKLVVYVWTDFLEFIDGTEAKEGIANFRIVS